MLPRRVSRRKFLILAGTTSSAAILAACAPQPAPATDVPAPTQAPVGPEKIALEMMVAGEDTDDVHKAAFKKFTDAHPEIDLSIAPVPGGQPELMAKASTRVAAGNPPDIIEVGTYGPCITWAKQKLMVDLRQMMSNDPDYKDNPIPESLLTLYTQAGVLYGIPKDYVTHAVIYNKTLLDEAGVEPPEDGWTWADVVEKGLQLTRGDGADRVFGWRSPTTQWWYEPYMLANDGPGFFDRRNWDFTVPTADNEKNAEALQWLYDTITVHEIAPTPEQLQAQDSSSRQLSGKLAMWASNTIETVALLENQDKIDWYVVPSPRAYPGGPSTTMVWTAGFGIFSATKSAEKSWEFIKHMSVGEGAETLGSTGFSIPSGRPEAFLTPGIVARGGQAFLDATKADVAMNDSLGEYHNEIINQVINPISEAVFLGKTKPLDAVKEIQKGMEDILAMNPE